ncbi:MAG: glycosyltransferase family 4 protein [Pirellulaceae bacterium]
MPSLRETLSGHVSAGHQVLLVMPRYNLFEDFPTEVRVDREAPWSVCVAPCSWVRPLLALRRTARRLSGGNEPIYPLRWSLNLLMCMLLTASLVRVAVRMRWWQKQRFDLVYAHNQYAALAGWLVGRSLRIPNVTRLYGTFLADLMKKPYVALRYPVAAAGFLVPHSLLICANDGTRGDKVAEHLRIDQRRFRFWQNGVDLPERPPESSRPRLMDEFSHLGLRMDSKWALSCSRLTYWKRIDRMIRALHGARQEGCDCQLLVAGTGIEEQSLRALAAELGVETDVLWLGAVDHDRVWELMHVADVFIITNDVTNRCNPLFEAICANLPVLSVYDPSTADLLEHGVNALLAEKDNVAGLAENMTRLCRETELASAMRHSQQRHAKRLWSWGERMVVEVRELEALVCLPAMAEADAK